MKKNERLFDLLGEVSPEFVAEVQKNKRVRRGGVTLSLKKTLSLIAAVVAVSVLMCAMLLPGSATVPGEGDVEYYEFGTVLTEIPRMLLAEDYEALIAVMDEQIAEHPEMRHQYVRFKSFYTLQSIEMQKSPMAREALAQIYPITQLADVYAIDPQSTMMEDEFLLYMLMYYAEMTQEDLIEMYTKMYDLVDASDLSEEEKARSRATLPEIPVIGEDDPVTYWVSGDKFDSKSGYASSYLPDVLTEEGYQELRTLIANEEDDAWSGFMPGELYLRMPAYTVHTTGGEERVHEENVAINEYMQGVIDAMGESEKVFYVLNPYATLHQRTLLCYYISQKTEVTQEQLIALETEFYDTLRSLPLSEKEINKLVETCQDLRKKIHP